MKFPTLESINGQVVNAVCFVMDYVELHFNGPIFRCLANPVLEMGDKRFVFPEAGTRDALCSLINDTLISVKIEEDQFIHLKFASGSKLSVALNDTNRVGPESAHYVSGINGPLEVW
jgi:hypothetical protein